MVGPPSAFRIRQAALDAIRRSALQQANILAMPTVWSDTTNVVSTNGFTNLVQQALASGVSNRYYRLRRP